ncbi:hypothetical protein B484DRAFT_445844 [Ochromonadaceae sp. CCMP2298]|nr:hypothetical protein B484DRAFT_445844 [Ochromonadaceae sp. CCMP2298]
MQYRATHMGEQTGPIKYHDVINFARRANDPNVHNCVMCGQHDVVIPSQNKDVCKSCDTSFWYNAQVDAVFKFCKGCKNFVSLSLFSDKPDASKCCKCRRRGRVNYLSKKGACVTPGSNGSNSNGSSLNSSMSSQDSDAGVHMSAAPMSAASSAHPCGQGMGMGMGNGLGPLVTPAALALSRLETELLMSTLAMHPAASMGGVGVGVGVGGARSQKPYKKRAFSMDEGPAAIATPYAFAGSAYAHAYDAHAHAQEKPPKAPRSLSCPQTLAYNAVTSASASASQFGQGMGVGQGGQGGQTYAASSPQQYAQSHTHSCDTAVGMGLGMATGTGASQAAQMAQYKQLQRLALGMGMGAQSRDGEDEDYLWARASYVPSPAHSARSAASAASMGSSAGSAVSAGSGTMDQGDSPQVEAQASTSGAGASPGWESACAQLMRDRTAMYEYVLLQRGLGMGLGQMQAPAQGQGQDQGPEMHTGGGRAGSESEGSNSDNDTIDLYPGGVLGERLPTTHRTALGEGLGLGQGGLFPVLGSVYSRPALSLSTMPTSMSISAPEGEYGMGTAVGVGGRRRSLCKQVSFDSMLGKAPASPPAPACDALQGQGQGGFFRPQASSPHKQSPAKSLGAGAGAGVSDMQWQWDPSVNPLMHLAMVTEQI